MGDRPQDESAVMSAVKATMHVKHRDARLTETADGKRHNSRNREFCKALRTSVSVFEIPGPRKLIFGSRLKTMT